MLLPAEMTVALDRAHQHRVGILRLRNLRRVLSRRRLIHAGRRLHPPAPRAAHMVVIVTKPVQLPLLPRQSWPDATPASACGASARGALLLRMSGLDALRHDASLIHHTASRDSPPTAEWQTATVVVRIHHGSPYSRKPPRRSPAHAPCPSSPPPARAEDSGCMHR